MFSILIATQSHTPVSTTRSTFPRCQGGDHLCISTELPGKETICKNAARSTGTLRPKVWPPDIGMMMTGQRGK